MGPSQNQEVAPEYAFVDETELPEEYTFEEEKSPQEYAFVDEAELPEDITFDKEETEQEEGGVVEAFKKFFKGMAEHEANRELQDLEVGKERPQAYANLAKGYASGYTFGGTEHIPGMEEPEDDAGKVIFKGAEFGSTLGLLKVIGKYVGKGALAVARKSPVLQKYIASGLTLFGTGATHRTGENIFKKGEIDLVDSIIHGGEWVALAGILKTAGKTVEFSDKLAQKADIYKVPRDWIVNKVISAIESSGVKFATEEEVAKYAMEALEGDFGSKTIKTIQKGQKTFQERVTKQTEAQRQAAKEAGEKMKHIKVRDESVVKINENARVLSKEITPKNTDVRQDIERLADTALKNEIEQVGTRAMTEEETGEFVKAAIELELEDAILNVKPLYNEAKDRAAHIKMRADKTGYKMANQLQEITKVGTKPENYGKAISAYETALQDMGAVIQRDVHGNIEQIIFEEVPVDNLIELTQRLSKIIKYDIVDKNIINTLEKHVQSLKNEIRTALAADSEASAAFEMAEAEYRDAIAPRFKNKTVKKIRATEEGEQIAKAIDSPHAMNQLQKALAPEEYVELERQVLEKLQEGSFDQAQKYYNRMKDTLSPKNKKLAEDIVKYKNPNNPEMRKTLAHREILEDVGKAFNSGTRPEHTLKLWQTPRGAKVVKKAFQNSPNWPEVKKYLETQTFADMVKTITKTGEFNGTKLRELMKNPQFRESIKSLGGKDALEFFETLDKRVDMFQKASDKLFESVPSKDMWNRIKYALERAEKDTAGQELLKKMAAKDYPWSKRFSDWEKWVSAQLGFNGKQLISVISLGKMMSAAGVKGLAASAGSMVAYRLMRKLATDRAFRKMFIQAAKGESNPVTFVYSISKLAEKLNEEEE